MKAILIGHMIFCVLTIQDKPFTSTKSVLTEDIAFIQYTGATTGKPKGAMLLHRSIVANFTQINLWFSAQIKDMDKQVVISALPLYHIFSLTANLLTFFL